MNIDSRKRAVRAAKRFVRLAESLPIITRPDTEMKWLETGTKLSGQVKRASLDLTRALAEMRKP